MDVSSAALVIGVSILLLEGWNSGKIAGTCSTDGSSTSHEAPRLLKWALLALTATLLLAVRRKEAQARALACELRTLQDEYEAQEAKLASVVTRLDESTASYDALINLLTFRPQGENSMENSVDGPSRDAEIVPPPATPIPVEVDGQPDATLAHALRERRLDWSAAIRAATRIRDSDYTLALFYADCRSAFPELCLYTCERQSEMTGQVEVSSGVSGNDEYKRTIGALFAVYW